LIIYRSRYRPFFFNKNRKVTRHSNHGSLVSDPYRIQACLVYRERCWTPVYDSIVYARYTCLVA
jgi:hypothetical protein